MKLHHITYCRYIITDRIINIEIQKNNNIYMLSIYVCINVGIY